MILDYLSKNMDNLDFEVANVCCDLLINKNRYHLMTEDLKNAAY